MPGKKPDFIKSFSDFYVTLASNSPQRQQILSELGVRYHVVIPKYKETTEKTADNTVCENAKHKLSEASFDCPNDVIISADTVLVFNEFIMGKPHSPTKARQYLSLISGNKIKAFSAVAVGSLIMKKAIVILEFAEVKMRRLTKDLINWYIDLKEPLNCAGALCISRFGEILVEKIDGEYSCVAGLPKRALLLALSDLDVGDVDFKVDEKVKRTFLTKYILSRQSFKFPKKRNALRYDL